MKALSITEPYASLILEGKKHIETRSWSTQYRGKILVHASATRIPKEWRNLLPLIREPRNGYVLCTADLVDCYEMTEDFCRMMELLDYDEYRVGFYAPGRYAWILSNVQPIEPFKAKGHLGLWEVPTMKYYLSKTWMGYEVVREDHSGRKEYLMSVYRGQYKWVVDYTYAAKYTKKTAMKHMKEVQS